MIVNTAILRQPLNWLVILFLAWFWFTAFEILARHYRDTRMSEPPPEAAAAG